MQHRRGISSHYFSLGLVFLLSFSLQACFSEPDPVEDGGGIAAEVEECPEESGIAPDGCPASLTPVDQDESADNTEPEEDPDETGLGPLPDVAIPLAAVSACGEMPNETHSLVKITRDGDKLTVEPLAEGQHEPEAFTDSQLITSYLGDLFSINIETGEQTQLTSDPGWEESAAISPDGDLFFLLHDSATGETQIMNMPLIGGIPEAVAAEDFPHPSMSGLAFLAMHCSYPALTSMHRQSYRTFLS